MKNAWSAIKPIALTVVGTLAVLLALFGCPLAIVLALLFPRLKSASRPGKLGMEDVLRNVLRLSLICGLAMALALAVSWLVLGHPWAGPG